MHFIINAMVFTTIIAILRIDFSMLKFKKSPLLIPDKLKDIYERVSRYN